MGEISAKAGGKSTLEMRNGFFNVAWTSAEKGRYNYLRQVWSIRGRRSAWRTDILASAPSDVESKPLLAIGKLRRRSARVSATWVAIGPWASAHPP